MFKNGIKLRKRGSSRSKKAQSCYEGQLPDWTSIVTDADDNEKFESTTTLTRNSSTNLNQNSNDSNNQYKQKTQTLPRNSSLNRNSRYAQRNQTLPRKFNSTHNNSIDVDDDFMYRDNSRVRFNEDSIKSDSKSNLSNSVSCIVVRKKFGDIQQALANSRNNVNSPSFMDQMSANDNSSYDSHQTNGLNRNNSKINGQILVKMRKSNKVGDNFRAKSVDRHHSILKTKTNYIGDDHSYNDDDDDGDGYDANVKLNVKIKRAYSTLNTNSIPNTTRNSSSPTMLSSLTSPISPNGQSNFRWSQARTPQPKISFKCAVDGPVPYINYSRPNITLRTRLKRCPKP